MKYINVGIIRGKVTSLIPPTSEIKNIAPEPIHGKGSRLFKEKYTLDN